MLIKSILKGLLKESSPIDNLTRDIMTLQLEATKLDLDPDKIWKDLYIKRDNNKMKTASFINRMIENSSNLLVYGNAGVGKSHYINHILKSCNISDKKKLHFILIDRQRFRNSESKDIALYLTQELSSFLSEFYQREISKEEINFNSYHAINKNIYDTLTSLTKENKLTVKPIIILDDFDYSERDIFIQLIPDILPYAAATFSSVIICARPSLEYTLHGITSFKRDFFKYDTKPISLNENVPSAHEIFNSRRDFLFEYFKNDRFLAVMLNKKRYKDFVNRIKFSDVHFSFIDMYSNDNIRDKIYLIYESLKYVFDNLDEFFSTINDIKFGYSKLIDFYSSVETPRINKIINIYDEKKTSKKGNVSYYKFEILKTIKSHPIHIPQTINEDFFENLRIDFGFKKDTILSNMKQLENERLIYRKGMGFFDEGGDDISIGKSYAITMRGRYYLENLVTLPEYNECFKE